MLTLIADEIAPSGFGIDSLRACVCVDIDIADEKVPVFGIDSV